MSIFHNPIYPENSEFSFPFDGYNWTLKDSQTLPHNFISLCRDNTVIIWLGLCQECTYIAFLLVFREEHFLWRNTENHQKIVYTFKFVPSVQSLWLIPRLWYSLPLCPVCSQTQGPAFICMVSALLEWLAVRCPWAPGLMTIEHTVSQRWRKNQWF